MNAKPFARDIAEWPRISSNHCNLPLTTSERKLENENENSGNHPGNGWPDDRSRFGASRRRHDQLHRQRDRLHLQDQRRHQRPDRGAAAREHQRAVKAGATAGRTPFVLALSGCSVAKEAPTKVSVTFEPGTSVNADTGRLKLQGADAAGNVEIALLNDQFKPIKVGAASADQNSQIVDIDATSGAAKMTYAAEYTATGVATAGTANSFVQYTLMYP